MSDRQLSLTDVQNGMFKQSVQMKLGGSLFQFLWGLIMTANNLKPRFKNPFDLTVGQAIGIGGGNSRQAVWTKQQKLKKIRIEGQWLVKIKNGNKQKNIPATYEINYNLIVPPNLVVPEFDGVFWVMLLRQQLVFWLIPGERQLRRSLITWNRSCGS